MLIPAHVQYGDTKRPQTCGTVGKTSTQFVIKHTCPCHENGPITEHFQSGLDHMIKVTSKLCVLLLHIAQLHHQLLTGDTLQVGLFVPVGQQHSSHHELKPWVARGLLLANTTMGHDKSSEARGSRLQKTPSAVCSLKITLHTAVFELCKLILIAQVEPPPPPPPPPNEVFSSGGRPFLASFTPLYLSL